MATVKSTYTGALSTQTRTPLSEVSIATKAPDFGPTDMLSVALASCMLSYIGYFGKEHHYDITGAEVTVEKTYLKDQSRIQSYHITFDFPHAFSDAQQEVIERMAKTCPVGNSLNPAIEREYVFNYSA